MRAGTDVHLDFALGHAQAVLHRHDLPGLARKLVSQLHDLVQGQLVVLDELPGKGEA